MDYGALVHNTAFGSLSDSSPDPVVPAEADFIDELLVQGCWLETTGGSSSYDLMMMMQQQQAQACDQISTTASLSDPSHYLATCNSEQQSNHHQNQILFQLQESEDQESNFVVGKRWWIGPRANPGPSSSVKERLVVAVGYLKEYTKNTNVLIQIWVPPRRGLDQYLHRNINVSNPTDEDDSINNSSIGFPMSPAAAAGPNPNPNANVLFFRSHDYPREHYAQQQYDVRGSLALPVFERGTGTCLGVVEIVMTNQNIINNYRPQLENVCNALEAVDFRSYQNFIPPTVKVFDELYQAALNEIVEVLTSVCKTHNLPLGLTWAPCIQQGKCGCSAAHDSYGSNNCVSTVDSACFVADLDILRFQEACSEYHLFHGQGVVGTAFATTKPCFAIDITAFSKAEYPLAHHAKMFGLHAAVAIPLRSVYTGSSADFVLEFFLPKDCQDSEEQKQMLNSLSMLVQQSCRSLHVAILMDQQQVDDFMLPAGPAQQYPKDHDHHKLLFASDHPTQSQVIAAEAAAAACSKESSTSSWVAHMMEAQQKGKGRVSAVSLEYQLEEPKEEFKVTTNWDSTNEQEAQVFSDFAGQLHEQSSSGLGSRSRASVVEESYTFGGGGRRSSCSSGGGRKSGEKRRTKAEKTISLPVLRQYFAGSLKDAAKSIGVCPTTLKRICRQHGITRWPSRKIKKVGHSLKKLQLVIDSVQGAEGAIQIGSFYSSFPELISTDFSSSTGRSADQSSKKMHNITSTSTYDVENINGFYGHGGGDHHGSVMTTLKSPPSACSQTFAGNQHNSTLINTTNGDVVMIEESPEAFKRAHSSEAAELQHASLIQEEDTKHVTRSKSQTTLPSLMSESININACWNNSRGERGGAFRVKATFVDEKIRFSLQPNWGFRDLQLEIARRFNLNDVSNIDLKYLDDDGEWVLLACDADLEECKDIHRSSQSRTIRLSLFQASPLNLANTFGGGNSPS